MAHIIDAIFKLTDQLTGPLKKAQSGLTQYSRQITRTGKEMQKFSKSVTNVGKSLTATVTTPLVGLGVTAVNSSKELDKILSSVNALSKGGAKEFEDLRKEALSLGASTAFSASEVAQGFEYMALAGWDSTQMIAGAKGVLDAAAASGEDLALVSDIITDSLSTFGMEAEESSRMADVLAQTASSSNTTIGMMGEAFTYAGSVAGAFGYTIEDTALAVGLMANAGIKASQAGTALRKIMTETNGAFEITGENLGKYVIQSTDANGAMIPFKETLIDMRKAFNQLTPAEKAANAEAIAGKTGMAGLLAIMNASEEEFNNLANAIDNSKDSAARMAEQMLDNLYGALEELGGAIETMLILIGDQLTPYVKKAADVIQGLVEKFNKLSKEQQGNIVKWMLLAASIGPGLLIYGKVVGVIATVILTMGKFGKAVKTAGGLGKHLVKAFNPATKIILIITLIAVAALLIYKYWEPIKEFFSNLFSKIKEYLINTGLDMNILKEAWATVTNALKLGVTYIIGIFMKLYNEVFPPLATAFGGVVGGILGAVKGLLTGIAPIINGVMLIFKGIVDFIVGIFTDNWSLAWQGVVEIFGGIFETLKGIAKGVINGIIGMINGGIKGINQVGSFFGMEEKTFTEIPMLYKGTQNWQGGTAMIHDQGAEIVDLPRGSRVYPHSKSLQMAYADGQQSNTNTNSFSIAKLADTIIVREDADIDKIANALYKKISNAAFNM